MGKDIVLVADYHAENVEFRSFNEATGEERTGNYPTTRSRIAGQVEDACRQLPPGGSVVWIMESTTGWARVKELVGSRAKFITVNVLQMPLPPKARRRKTDKIDTARMLREYLQGTLPESFQPSAWLRQVRRVVDLRWDLVNRQTALKNWITSLLHQETWYDRSNLWSGAGLDRLGGYELSRTDRELVELKLEELEFLARQRAKVEARMQEIYDAWPEAQRLDEIRGIGMVTAVSLAAHIGPIERFPTAEDLISYAGLAPGVSQSDGTCHNGGIAWGGTDGMLRTMVIEASTWLCQIPRYRATWERAVARRGKKVGRIVVARMVLRSIHKMLTDGVRFNPRPLGPRSRTRSAERMEKVNTNR